MFPLVKSLSHFLLPLSSVITMIYAIGRLIDFLILDFSKLSVPWHHGGHRQFADSYESHFCKPLWNCFYRTLSARCILIQILPNCPQKDEFGQVEYFS